MHVYLEHSPEAVTVCDESHEAMTVVHSLVARHADFDEDELADLLAAAYAKRPRPLGLLAPHPRRGDDQGLREGHTLDYPPSHQLCGRKPGNAFRVSLCVP